MKVISDSLESKVVRSLQLKEIKMDKTKLLFKKVFISEFTTPSVFKSFRMKVVVLFQNLKVKVINKEGPVSTVEVVAPPPKTEPIPKALEIVELPKKSRRKPQRMIRQEELMTKLSLNLVKKSLFVPMNLIRKSQRLMNMKKWLCLEVNINEESPMSTVEVVAPPPNKYNPEGPMR